MKNIFLLILAIIHFLNSHSQQFRPMNSVTIYEKLNAIKNLNTVMYVAAHPDDENTRLLSYLVHHEKLHTIYLSLTRGDGGQNLIGTELGIGLGLIRNYELLEARKMDGADQIFGNVLDFGYSKNHKETFLHWDQQELIDDVKKAIQIYRPEIVICRFPTTGEGGHGQHTASAIATVEAYRQLKEESKYNRNLFLPKRIIFNAFQFGSRSTIKENQIKLLTNQYNALLGESYGEMAGRSRSIHRSQGVGTPQNIGINNEHFELMIGEEMSHSIFDGIDTNWNIINQSNLKTELEKIINNYSFINPEMSIPKLIKFRDKVSNQVVNEYYKKKILQQLDPIILSCAGLTIDVLNDQEFVTLNDSLQLTTRIIARTNKSEVPVIFVQAFIDEITLNDTPSTLQNDTVLQFQNKINIPNNKQIDQPYWLKTPPINNRFIIDEKDYTNAKSTPQLITTVTLKILNEIFDISVPVSYKYLDPLKGDVIRQVHIVPDVTLEPTQEKIFIDKNNKTADINLQIKPNRNIDNATILVTLKPFNHTKNKYGEHTPDNIINEKIILQKPIPSLVKNKNQLIELDIPAVGEGQLSFSINTNNNSNKLSQKIIEYDHLPKLIYYQEASTDIINKDFIVPYGKYGYIEGAGDLVYEYLKKIGLNIEKINNNNLNNLSLLKQYKSIIIGVRAYNTNTQLVNANPTLMQYIKEGGKVIVQYNTNNNLLLKDFAPYPMSISRDRVTMENVPVTIEDSTNQYLFTPNKITDKDFDDWVQERGLYFPTNIDNKYKTLLSMNDELEDEIPLKNSIIYADYGNGKYVYTGLSFFRQLPAANKGAIKLLLNLIN